MTCKALMHHRHRNNSDWTSEFRPPYLLCNGAKRKSRLQNSKKTRDGFHAKVTKEWNSYFFHKDCFFAWWNCSISTQKSTNDDDFTVTKMLQFPNECQELTNWIFAFWIFCHGALSKREIMKCLKPLIFFSSLKSSIKQSTKPRNYYYTRVSSPFSLPSK